MTIRSEQWVEVDDAGGIVRIEHRDLPGQVEALRDFKDRLIKSGPVEE